LDNTGGFKMPEGTNNDSQVCAWCSKSIPADAVKCPYCQKWRKDIDRDRTIAYVWGFIGAIPGAIIGVALVNNKSFMGTGRGTLAILSFIISFAITLYYTARVSRKIGTWWWF
jgi:hypothetical protein